MLSDVTMRTLYLRDDAAAAMPLSCRVLPVSPLLRELIVRATELPLQYDEDGPAGHVIALILAELHGLQSLPLQLPMPQEPRLGRSAWPCSPTPGDQRTLGDWARTVNASERTVARLFQSETGLSFGAWRQQARLLEAMGRLGSGAPGDPGGARPRLRQCQRLQRHVPPRRRRLAQRLSAPSRDKPLLQVGDFCVPATLCHTETLT